MTMTEQIQDVSSSVTLTELLSSVTASINTEEFIAASSGVKISPLAIYCQKTGKQIGMRFENQFIKCISVHGKEFAKFAFQNSPGLCVDAQWLWTNSQNLDDMQEHDGAGYAVFAIAALAQSSNARAKRGENVADRQWALARANVLCSQLGDWQLMELNAALCRALTYAPDSVRYLGRLISPKAVTIDNLAISARSGELAAILRQAVEATIAQVTNHSIALGLKLREASSVHDKAKGPSNIRGQRASRRGVSYDQIGGRGQDKTLMRSISDLDAHNKFKLNASIDKAFGKLFGALDQAESLRSRVLHESADTKRLHASLANAFADMDFSDIDAHVPDSWDDNSVSVRTLTPEQYEDVSLRNERDAEPIEPIEPPPTITTSELRSRFAAIGKATAKATETAKPTTSISALDILRAKLKGNNNG